MNTEECVLHAFEDEELGLAVRVISERNVRRDFSGLDKFLASVPIRIEIRPDDEWITLDEYTTDTMPKIPGSPEPPDECPCGHPAEIRALIPLHTGDGVKWRCTTCMRRRLEKA